MTTVKGITTSDGKRGVHFPQTLKFGIFYNVFVNDLLSWFNEIVFQLPTDDTHNFCHAKSENAIFEKLGAPQPGWMKGVSS